MLRQLVTAIAALIVLAGAAAARLSKVRMAPHLIIRSPLAAMLLWLVCGRSFAQAPEPPTPPPPPPVTPGVPVEVLPPECSGLISVIHQPSLDPLIAMLDARTDIPANAYFRLRLSFTIDADGAPIDVSISQSSQDRDVDRAAIEWARDVRFSSAPGCTGKRHGLLPMYLLP